MTDFLLENVAKHAKALPRQIAWGREADQLIKQNGCLTKEDLERLAPIWREGASDAVKDTGDRLVNSQTSETPKAKGYQLDLETLNRCMGKGVSEHQLEDLNRCIEHYEINRTKARLCFFLSQIGHESAGLYYIKEIDPGWYIPRNFGLPELAGSDGAYKFRGAGYLQLSMPDNYQAFSQEMGDPLIYELGCPYVAENYPATSAGFWWQMNDMNACVDRGEDIYQISGRVNCGSPGCAANGMSDRYDYYLRAVGSIPEF